MTWNVMDGDGYYQQYDSFPAFVSLCLADHGCTAIIATCDIP